MVSTEDMNLKTQAVDDSLATLNVESKIKC